MLQEIWGIIDKIYKISLKTIRKTTLVISKEIQNRLSLNQALKNKRK
jgi:hypothetical protein